MSIDVAFIDTSQPGPSGPITAQSWDFGDGGTSTDQDPVHGYATAGTYSVTLTVTGSGSDGTATATQPVDVVDPGTNVLTAAFTESESGLVVSFLDQSLPGPSGPITGRSWNFGDGNTSTLLNPSHTYAAAGTYTVTLTVTGTSPDGTDNTSVSVTVAAPSGTIIWDGRATRMTTLVGHKVATVPPDPVPAAGTYTNTQTRSDGSKDYYYLYQSPKLWDGLTFQYDDISLVSDARYTKVYGVRCEIGDSSIWQPPGSFLAVNKGAAQITHIRPNWLGQWKYYALATKVPSWSGSPAACEWFDFCSLGYQTSRGDQFAFRIVANSGSPTGLSYNITANVGHASDPTVFNADHRWSTSFLPVVFNQWDEWVFAIKWETDNTGAVQVYHRAPGGTWLKPLEKLNTPTYLWGTTSYGTFAADGSNWPGVLDKLGLYYGRYPAGTVENVKETGIVICSDLATAKAQFPA